VEQGYRADLKRTAPTRSTASSELMNPELEDGKGEFRKMMESQRAMGGFPEKDIDGAVAGDEHEDFEATHLDEPPREQIIDKHPSLNSIRPLTFGNWMFDVVADLTAEGSPVAPQDAIANSRPSRPLSRFIPFPTITTEGGQEASEGLQHVPRLRRPSSTLINPTTPTPIGYVPRRRSLQFSPTSTVFSPSWSQVSLKDVQQMQEEEDDNEFFEQKEAVRGAGRVAAVTREKRNRNRPQIAIRISSPTPAEQPEDVSANVQEKVDQPPKFWKLLRRSWPTIPQKPVLIFGFFICIASGSITPIFSFLLSQLLFQVSIGAHHISTINTFGAVVLSVAALDGILLGLKYYVLEYVGMQWATRLRTTAYYKVLQQDKSWFDSTKNGPARLIQVIVKDGDDSRTLISTVIGQSLVVCAMLSVGLLWAMVRGWELTLVGLGIAPIFAGVMSIQTQLVGKCEVKNKRAREAVGRGWYDFLCNIKGIRAMGIAKPFLDSFESSVEDALDTGVRGAWVEGGTLGVSSGLIYAAEAVLFYVGAVLVAKGRYTYLQMIEVLNLVVFSVTIGSQLMAFSE
jgi:ATP-binding cassette subfamily B (MDR/TAP) protein 1